MPEKTGPPKQFVGAIPPDDPLRKLAIAQPDTDRKIAHIAFFLKSA
ncbi:MAG TPA: hypothetical protein VH724_11230 [Candidatus Angelobacter sp.]|nr:hypothetical protein [Candidatus Angelobacter sp.]